jgi:hypothetical protein
VSATPKPLSPLLTSGLKEAERLALLPDDADVALIGTVEGDSVRVGVVIRAGKHWQVESDLGLHKGKVIGGRVMVVGKL